MCNGLCVLLVSSLGVVTSGICVSVICVPFGWHCFSETLRMNINIKLLTTTTGTINVPKYSGKGGTTTNYILCDGYQLIPEDKKIC